MADTRIEWATKSWSVVLGCQRVGTPGCDRCYAIRTAYRLAHMPHAQDLYAGLTTLAPDGLDWTGVVRTVPARLADPLRWRKPQQVFVNSQSDLFHADVPEEFIARMFAVMAITPRHIYQILTKRHGRMRSLLSSDVFAGAVDRLAAGIAHDNDLPCPDEIPWPLPNLWLGVSAEDQARADLRIPALLETPAAVRWVSAEPLLGAIDMHGPVDQFGCRPRLNYWIGSPRPSLGTIDLTTGVTTPPATYHTLDWVVVGGESGPGARPMDLAAAAHIVAQCQQAGVPVFMKQLGTVVGGRDHHDLATFPEVLRVREYPAAREAVSTR